MLEVVNLYLKGHGFDVQLVAAFLGVIIGISSTTLAFLKYVRARQQDHFSELLEAESQIEVWKGKSAEHSRLAQELNKELEVIKKRLPDYLMQTVDADVAAGNFKRISYILDKWVESEACSLSDVFYEAGNRRVAMMAHFELESAAFVDAKRLIEISRLLSPANTKAEELHKTLRARDTANRLVTDDLHPFDANWSELHGLVGEIGAIGLKELDQARLKAEAQDDYILAYSLQHRIWTEMRNIYGPSHSRTLVATNILATLLFKLQKYEDATSLIEATLTEEILFDEAKRNEVVNIANTALASYIIQVNIPDAKKLFERVFDKDIPDRIASKCLNILDGIPALVSTCCMFYEYQLAIDISERLTELELQHRNLTTSAAKSQCDFAYLLAKVYEIDKAKKLAVDVESMIVTASEQDLPLIIPALDKIRLLIMQGRYAEAAKNAEREIRGIKTSGIAYDHDNVRFIEALGLANLRQRKWGESVRFFRQALAIRDDLSEGIASDLYFCIVNLANSLSLVENHDESLSLLIRAEHIMAEDGASESIDGVLVKIELAKIYARQRMVKASLGLIDQVVFAIDEKFENYQMVRFEAIQIGVKLRKSIGNVNSAANVLQAAVTHLEATREPSCRSTLKARLKLSKAFHNAGRVKEAKSLLVEIYTLSVTNYGENDSLSVQTKNALSKV